jgi:hypothetical protein
VTVNHQTHLTMNLYTVIVYVPPAGPHQVEEMEAENATADVDQRRERMLLTREDCEVVAVVCRRVLFECVDAKEVALAPYCGPELP